MRSSPLRSHWRWVVAALLAEIAAIHISLAPPHPREALLCGRAVHRA
jgi:hypothetical protein